MKDGASVNSYMFKMLYSKRIVSIKNSLTILSSYRKNMKSQILDSVFRKKLKKTQKSSLFRKFVGCLRDLIDHLILLNRDHTAYKLNFK